MEDNQKIEKENITNFNLEKDLLVCYKLNTKVKKRLIIFQWIAVITVIIACVFIILFLLNVIKLYKGEIQDGKIEFITINWLIWLILCIYLIVLAMFYKMLPNWNKKTMSIIDRKYGYLFDDFITKKGDFDDKIITYEKFKNEFDEWFKINKDSYIDKIISYEKNKDKYDEWYNKIKFLY